MSVKEIEIGECSDSRSRGRQKRADAAKMGAATRPRKLSWDKEPALCAAYKLKYQYLLGHS